MKSKEGLEERLEFLFRILPSVLKSARSMTSVWILSSVLSTRWGSRATS